MMLEPVIPLSFCLDGSENVADSLAHGGRDKCSITIYKTKRWWPPGSSPRAASLFRNHLKQNYKNYLQTSCVSNIFDFLLTFDFYQKIFLLLCYTRCIRYWSNEKELLKREACPSKLSLQTRKTFATNLERKYEKHAATSVQCTENCSLDNVL